MDKKAHVLSSSSQNVRKQIYGQIRRGAAGKGYFAVSEDGSSFSIPKSVVSRYALHYGQDLTSGEFEELAHGSAYVTVKTKALDLLALREHSVQELRQKLQNRSYDPAIIEQILEEFQHCRYLDDQRFAEVWIRSRSRKRPESQQMLIAGLCKRGVTHELAVRAVEDADIDPEELLDRAVAKYAKKGEDPIKLMNRLVRKGFSYGDVRRAVIRREGPEESGS